MRAGNLDQIVTIQRSAQTLNEYGAPVFTWTDIDTLRAQKVEASTDEFLRDYGATDETAVVFRVRWRDGITPADRIIHDGLIFDLKQVKEIGRRKGLELRCVSTGQEAAP
ncbi:phage head closure protein [Martelella mediterranea]|uniref:Putative phage head-tail adaptor n=1 Tax=Martelella mediterranea DSM 17316 TaxID=1122214 RepID=A0A1U9YYM6_9HYPH|nr:phage head closure protein [Martelella mediterranea]AQZ50528.1 putative phage head-tail adaptor [Martelella mediterranea DSM 17316]